MPTDITPHGFINAPKKPLTFRDDSFWSRTVQQRMLKKGDIILVAQGRGTLARVAIVEEIPKGQAWFAGQMLMMLRPTGCIGELDPVWIFMWLRQKCVRRILLRKQVVSGTNPLLKRGDIEALDVALPAGEEDLAAKRAWFAELREEVRALEEQQARTDLCSDRSFLRDVSSSVTPGNH